MLCSISEYFKLVAYGTSTYRVVLVLVLVQVRVLVLVVGLIVRFVVIYFMMFLSIIG